MILRLYSPLGVHFSRAFETNQPFFVPSLFVSLLVRRRLFLVLGTPLRAGESHAFRFLKKTLPLSMAGYIQASFTCLSSISSRLLIISEKRANMQREMAHLNSLRQRLKTWEKDYEEKNWRKPKPEDIRRIPEIGKWG